MTPIRQGMIQKAHEVLIVCLAIFAPDVGKHLAAPVAAPGVAEDDKVAAVGPDLHLMEIHVGKRGTGAAVDVEDHGELLPRFIAGGPHDPAAKFRAIRRRTVQRHRPDHAVCGEKAGIQLSDALLAQIELLEPAVPLAAP